MQDFIKALCEIFDTLSDSLTLQYLEDSGEVWVLDTKSKNKLYMGDIDTIIKRASNQQIINEMEGEN
jgi:hypothetical protein